MELTLERLKTLFVYATETGQFTRLVARGQYPAGSIAGCISKADGYVRIRVDDRTYSAHRLAYFYMLGEWPIFEMDHKNGNCADNRWENLRAATSAENGANRRLRSDNTSGVKGVRFHAQSGKWRAEITLSKKRLHLGLFPTLEAADTAIRSVREKAHGEFVRHA